MMMLMAVRSAPLLVGWLTGRLGRRLLALAQVLCGTSEMATRSVLSPTTTTLAVVVAAKRMAQ
jgi:hypothetical protein